MDDVSFDIYPAKRLAWVGESGCGKIRLDIRSCACCPRLGGVFYRGKDVHTAKGSEDLKLCKSMQIIFQDPYSSLNPRKTIRSILREPYIIHKYGSKETIDKAIDEISDMVELSRDLLSCFPHELDGGCARS